MNGRVVEISHPIRDGMDTYPGLPRPAVTLHTPHAPSHPEDTRARFAIGRLDLVANVGTYLDSPFHRYPDGHDVSQIPLDRLIDLPTTVIDTTSQRRRDLDVALPDHRSLAGRAVLVRTGWDQRWDTPQYWQPAPFLTSAMVDRIMSQRPALVGIDTWNIDDIDDPIRPAHTRLLGAGIPIVEHLCHLDEVDDDARTSFVPLAVVGAPSLPVRAFAIRPPEPTN